ncbi:MAG: DUF2802 domain-containing protein [Gammaproteobacteria bacterium]|nr:DUF2802 domain-containing protein [Gammaproteobacteria bacterium]
MNSVLSSVPVTSLALATLAMSAISMLILIAMVIMYRYFNKMLNQQEITIEILKDDLSALCAGAIGIGEHVARLEENSRSLTVRQDKLEMQEAPERSYKQALKMAQRGAELNEVIKDCGIAHGEAELILLANRLDKAS